MLVAAQLRGRADRWLAFARRGRSPRTLRLYKKSPSLDDTMLTTNSTSQNALYSTLAHAGGVNAPPKIDQSRSGGLFIQPR